LQQDFVSYSLRVRARDQAGNENSPLLARALAVDNVPPSTMPVTFTPVVGTHLDTSPGPVTATWGATRDGSGLAAVRVLFDQSPETLPDATADRSGNTFVASLSTGTWYAHVAVVDGGGNRVDRHFG